MNEYRWSTSGLTENVVDAIAIEHGLNVAPGSKELVGENLADDKAPFAEIDIEFARRNPSLPIENVCSRLDNYDPQNPSQEALLAMARKLVGYSNPTRLAGFIACGGAGLGKTHVSVAVAKAAMMAGQRPFYVSVPGNSMAGPEDIRDSREADIVVIDDLNTAYGGAFGASEVRELLSDMHNRGGGKLMITSNAPSIEVFLNRILLPGDPVERMRIQDRVSASLLGLEVVGDSFRSQNTDGLKPWWEE